MSDRLPQVAGMSLDTGRELAHIRSAWQSADSNRDFAVTREELVAAAEAIAPSMTGFLGMLRIRFLLVEQLWADALGGLAAPPVEARALPTTLGYSAERERLWRA